MKKKLQAGLHILILTAILIIPGLVFATTTTPLNSSASPLDRLNKAAVSYGPFNSNADENTLTVTLGTIINIIFSLLGIVFVFIFIIAGYEWMTAGGNEQTITKAKGSMKRAIIGLIVILSSYAIWTFIKTVFIKQI